MIIIWRDTPRTAEEGGVNTGRSLECNTLQHMSSSTCGSGDFMGSVDPLSIQIADEVVQRPQCASHSGGDRSAYIHPHCEWPPARSMLCGLPDQDNHLTDDTWKRVCDATRPTRRWFTFVMRRQDFIRIHAQGERLWGTEQTRGWKRCVARRH